MNEIVEMRNDLKLKDLYPRFAVRISRMLDFCRDKKWLVEIMQGLRTWEYQDELWRKGRDENGQPINYGTIEKPEYKIITNAKGGQSWHNFGLAVDICFKDENLNVLWDDPRYEELGLVAEYFKVHWLGKNKVIKGDIYHFDANFGYTIKELQEIYLNEGLHGVWKHLDFRTG